MALPQSAACCMPMGVKCASCASATDAAGSLCAACPCLTTYTVLSPGIASLSDVDPARDVVLMCEVAEEATYVPHHRKKIAFVLSAMRHFAQELRARGLRVDYVRLDDPANSGSFGGEVARAVARHAATRVVVAEPGGVEHGNQERHPGQAGDVEVAESRLQPAAGERAGELLRDSFGQSHFTVRNL